MNVNLTPDELRILPKILQSLKKRNIGNVVKKNDIVISLNEFYNLKLDSERVGKIINRIRANSNPIIENNQGYYYSEDIKDIEQQIIILENNITELKQSVKGLKNILNTLKKK